MRASFVSGLLFLLITLFVTPAQGAKDNQAGRALEGQVPVADLYVVDCLLPGQVRQLGNRTYLTPRRPVRRGCGTSA